MNNNAFLKDFSNGQKKIKVNLTPTKENSPLLFEENDYLGDCACSTENDFSQKLNTNKSDAENKPRIFISYARKDQNKTKQLFDELKRANCDPWRDSEKIFPGKDWELEIKKAMDKSDFVLVCLSKNSIRKKGIVQKEWKTALNIQKEYPEGSVFLIPIRLDDCEIPDSFKQFQCIDYSCSDWLKKLLTTIKQEMNHRKNKENKRTNHLYDESIRMKIEFINREHELDEIQNPGGPELMGVDAPPGYGKSRLLDEVENWYKTNKRDDWICVRINLNQNVDSYSTNPQLILNYIAEQIIGELTKSITPQILIGQMIDKKKNIILLFDAIESNPPAVKYLKDSFISPLLDTLKRTKLICRAVYAGRYIQNPLRDWRGQHIEWDWTNHKIVKLTGFDNKIVRQTIMRELEQTALREAEKEVLTKEIAFLSCGHPGIIEKMLHHPPNGNWALAFYKDQLKPETRKELFQNQAKPVIDNILDETHDKNLSEILKILSIFRRFNFNTIRALQSLARKKQYFLSIQQMIKNFIGVSLHEELLKPCEKCVDDAMVIITNLVNSGLVSAPTSAKPFYHDAVIRRLILIQMQLQENSHRYIQLNALAHAIYDIWLANKNVDGRELSPPLADNLQIECIAESFYHLLNCIKKDQHIQNERIVRTKLRSYIQILRSSFDTPKTILKDNLKSVLKQDEDIPALLRELLGEDGAHRIFALLS